MSVKSPTAAAPRNLWRVGGVGTAVGRAAALLVASAFIGPAAGCACPDVDCGAGAPVVVSLRDLDAGVAAEICFDDDCARATMSAYSDGEAPNPIPMATRDLDGSSVERGERFEVTISAFDANGDVVAERSQTRRRHDDGDCGCDGFGYRWDGETLADW